jgi:hypothetical protein
MQRKEVKPYMDPAVGLITVHEAVVDLQLAAQGRWTVALVGKRRCRRKRTRRRATTTKYSATDKLRKTCVPLKRGLAFACVALRVCLNWWLVRGYSA